MRPYNEELRNIRKKSRIVYSKSGIYPFLAQGVDGRDDYDYIPGFQIFSLWGDLLDDLALDDEE